MKTVYGGSIINSKQFLYVLDGTRMCMTQVTQSVPFSRLDWQFTFVLKAKRNF